MKVTDMLRTFSESCRTFYAEFDKVRDDDFLYKLEQDGPAIWETWLSEHKDEIISYVGKSVSERKKMLSQYDQEDKQKLILGAVLMLRKCYAIITLVNDINPQTESNIPKFLSHSVKTLFSSLEQVNVLWPIPRERAWNPEKNLVMPELSDWPWILPLSRKS